MTDQPTAPTRTDDDAPPPSSAVGSPAERQALQRRTLVVLASAQVVGNMGVATGMALATLVAVRLSGSGTVGGLAQTASVVGAALAAMPIAQLAVRYGRRWSLAAGFGVAAIGAVGAVGATAVGSWPLLVGSLVLFGAGGAAGLAARFAATDLSDPSRRARDLSVVIWAGTVGAVAGPNVAGVLDDWSHARGLLLSDSGAAVPGVPAPSGAAFALAALLFALAAAVVLVLLRPDPLAVVPGRRTRPPSAWRSLRTGLVVVRGAPSARLGLTIVVVSHTTMVGLMSMAPVHMDHHGASVRLVGLVLSLHIAGMYVLSPLLGWVADAVGAERVAVVGAVLLLGSTALLVAVPGQGLRLTAGLVLLGVGWSAGVVAGSALVAAAAVDDVRTAVQGTSDVAMSLGGAAGGLVAGAVVAVTSYSGLAIGAGVVLIGYVAYVGAVVVTRTRAPVRPA